MKYLLSLSLLLSLSTQAQTTTSYTALLSGHEIIFSGTSSSQYDEDEQLTSLTLNNLRVVFSDDVDTTYYLRAAYGYEEVAFGNLCAQITNGQLTYGHVERAHYQYLGVYVFTPPTFLVLYDGNTIKVIEDFSNLYYDGFSCNKAKI